MSEHITDSHILQSKKTYGRKNDGRHSSFLIENSEWYNDGMLGFTGYNDGLLSDDSLDFISKITGSCSEISSMQSNTVVDSEFSLYTEQDMEYHYSEKGDQNNSSILEVSNSGSNYQRTRKNQKNRLSNQRYSTEEISESKSASDGFNFNTTSTKQPLLITRDKQVKNSKIDGIKTNDACVKKSPQRPNVFQAGKNFGKGTNSPNTLSNTKLLPILDLVNRFTASRNQDNTKSNQNNKRKRVKEQNVSIPSKKIETAVTKHTSKVISSVENKMLNSTVSVKRYSKNTVLKTDAVNNEDTFKKGDTQLPSSSAQKKKRVSVDNTEVNKNTIGNVSSSPLKRVDVEKAVRKRKSKFEDETIKHVDMRQNVNGVVKASSKAVQRKNSISGNNIGKKNKKNVSKNSKVQNNILAKVKSSYLDLHTVRNEFNEERHYGDKQILTSNNDGLQIDKFHNSIDISHVNADLIHSLNMPLIIAPLPPSFEDGAGEVIPLGIWKTSPSITDNHTFQIDNNMDSYENSGDISIPGPSALAKNNLTVNDNNSTVENLETSEVYLITKDTTTTTIKNENCGYIKQRSVFRPRTHLSDGFDFFGFLSNSLKRIEGNCILHCKEQSSETFLMNPHLVNLTVKDFCNNLAVTDVLLDLLTKFDVNQSLAVHNSNKGYDFPENFESESLLRVIKDFVHTMISYIIKPNAVKSCDISGSHIMKHTVLNMSSREIIIMTRMFREPNHLYKLKDVLAKLSLVALFVIFDEYRNKKYRYVP